MAEARRVSAPVILAAYAAVSFAAIFAYEFFFPTVPAPLPPFFFKWRFFHAVAAYSTAFPAIALAAIAATFGFGNWGESDENRFVPGFLDSIKGPLFTSFAAAVLYAALFLFAQPSALDVISDMKSKGILFQTATQKAETALDQKNWREAKSFLNICQQVWPNSPDTEKARDRLNVGMAGGLTKENQKPAVKTRSEDTEAHTMAVAPYPGVDAKTTAAEALGIAQKALEAKRYYDAHWVATLAERLAKPGAAEKAAATRLATAAWNALAETEPSAADKSSFAIYKKKRDGYAAMLAEDWIRAYFIYEELSRDEPKDPDIIRFLKVSREGIKSLSFFADEVGASIGAVDLDVILSLPRKNSGRDILRIRRLHPFADAAYGEGLELISFDEAGALRYAVDAPYVKIVPFLLNRSSTETVSRTAVLMLALDRTDDSIRIRPRWTSGAAPDGAETRVVLDAPYENILLASRARRGVQALSVPELNKGAAILPSYGFVAEAFRAELIRRFAEPFAFLSLAVFVLGIAWRSRAPKSAGPGGLLILVILPFAFNVVVQGYRLLSSTSSTVFAVMLPFETALAAALGLQAALLLIALFFLAGQRS